MQARCVVFISSQEHRTASKWTSAKACIRNSSPSHLAHWGRWIFNLIIEALIDWAWVATLTSVGLKVLYPMVRIAVRRGINLHRPTALHLTSLCFPSCFSPCLFHRLTSVFYCDSFLPLKCFPPFQSICNRSSLIFLTLVQWEACRTYFYREGKGEVCLVPQSQK